MATSVKTIFRAAHVPIEWEQFDITGYTDSKDESKLRQAVDSIRKNKVALKGENRYLDLDFLVIAVLSTNIFFAFLLGFL